MKKMLNQESQHKARKRFGQNFLIDHGVIRDIVRSIHPHKDDQIVEIGPGKGAITQLLADSCDNISVIELDRDLVPWLKVKFELHLLTYSTRVRDMHFMLQKEVVKRMAAQAGDSAYGRLGIMVQYYCAVENLFEVPPGAFDPAPKVDSAIVRLIPHAQLPYVANNIKTLETLVNVAFQQRRKTLRNSLKQLLTPEQIESLPVDLTLRPENITLAQYVEISNLLGDISIVSSKPIGDE
jgi:16S rRNA (adenine1518-N6/adenine1519-N6)-dimethyltransferase